jgi:hypothetical protein
MQQIGFESSGRSMRWYEWVAGLCLLGAAAGVRAEVAYKCIDAQGAISYQDTACIGQRQSEIAITPSLRAAPVPTPHYAVERAATRRPERSVRVPREHAARESAFECRVSDGRIFYRLAGCPHSLAGEVSSTSAHRKGGTHGNSGPASVAARRIPREDACREIHRAGAIGRDGHEFDEHVSTYERNLGHDPCKS